MPLEIYLLGAKSKEHKRVSLCSVFFMPRFQGEGYREDKELLGAVLQLVCWLELHETQCAVSTEEAQLLAGSGDRGRPQRELF